MADKKTRKGPVRQQTDTNQIKAALADAFKTIEKNYGKGLVMKLGEKTDMNVEVIPTGSILLDDVLGVSGYPKGRIMTFDWITII